MTDTTSAPNIESDLEPMFTTGSQASLTPNTEPHSAPIFDTGPHPNPLQAFGPEPVVVYESAGEPVVESAGEPVVEPAVYESVGEPVVEPAGEPVVYESAYEPVVVYESESAGEDPAESSVPEAFSEMERDDTDAFLRSVTPQPVPVLAQWPPAQPVSVPAQPVVVPGTFEFVSRIRFGLILAGVWVVSAAAGLGFYYWWYSALDKTVPVLGILGYLVVCMVASLLVSLVPHRPQVTALAIAVMAAPLASTAAAAVLHGAYYFEWIARPVIGPVIG